MPATIPTRPAGGQVIATAWGQDIHDRAYTPKGVSVNGAVVAGITAVTLLPIDARVDGDAAYMDAAGDRIVIPATMSGLYLILLAAYAQNTLSWARVRVFRNGSAASPGMTTRGQGTTQAGLSLALVLTLADGDALQVQADADSADTADMKIDRLTVLRIGDSLG